MNDNQQLDNILDEALSTYREAEPLAGIEDRVLQRLRLHADEHRTAWWKWGAVAACAVLALVIWIGMTRRTPQTAAQAAQVAVQPKAIPQKQVSSTPTDGPTLVSENARAHSVFPRPAATASATLPYANAAMASVFPVPVPLTDEEQAFAAALDRHPDARPMPFASDTAPVIAKIEIKPLSTTEETSGDNQ